VRLVGFLSVHGVAFLQQLPKGRPAPPEVIAALGPAIAKNFGHTLPQAGENGGLRAEKPKNAAKVAARISEIDFLIPKPCTHVADRQTHHCRRHPHMLGGGRSALVEAIESVACHDRSESCLSLAVEPSSFRFRQTCSYPFFGSVRLLNEKAKKATCL